MHNYKFNYAGLLASAGSDGTIFIYTASSDLTLVKTIENAHASNICCLFYENESKWLISGSWDK